ncbi:glycosyltransferase family 4 protein [Candidatus Peribacteria bacterium]|nr:MAG: glycosyltransferase family 4 protein [Candidatus Peribacteria bacterium]
MKIIAIDCRFAATLSGIGRYTRELVTCLVEEDGDVHYVLFVRSPDEEWIPRSAHVQIVTADFPHYSLKEQTTLPSLLRKVHADLFFSPHFNIPFFCPVPFVVTIHDLILHRFPNDASRLKILLYKILISRAVRKATRILTVSDFTKTEIREMYGKRIAKKSHVVCEGVSSLYRPASETEQQRVRSVYGLDRPYLLYVGNAKEHKNVPLLLKAFSRVQQADRDLVLMTGGKEYEKLLPLPPHVRQLANVPDADMPALYSAADALVTASLYEGFCLPVAEALACGTPVIAASRSVLPEITAGHAMLIEPTVDAFADAMSMTFQKKEPYIVGTWTKAAQETAAILKNS